MSKLWCTTTVMWLSVMSCHQKRPFDKWMCAFPTKWWSPPPTVYPTNKSVSLVLLDIFPMYYCTMGPNFFWSCIWIISNLIISTLMIFFVFSVFFINRIKSLKILLWNHCELTALATPERLCYQFVKYCGCLLMYIIHRYALSMY